jgi:hypothetical protein
MVVFRRKDDANELVTVLLRVTTRQHLSDVSSRTLPARSPFSGSSREWKSGRGRSRGLSARDRLIVPRKYTTLLCANLPRNNERTFVTSIRLI